MSTDLELARADARRAYAEMEGIHAILLEHGCEPSPDGLRSLIERLSGQAEQTSATRVYPEGYVLQVEAALAKALGERAAILRAGGDALWAGKAKTLPEAVADLVAHAQAMSDKYLEADDEIARLRSAMATPEGYVGMVQEAVAEEVERLRAVIAQVGPGYHLEWSGDWLVLVVGPYRVAVADIERYDDTGYAQLALYGWSPRSGGYHLATCPGEDVPDGCMDQYGCQTMYCASPLEAMRVCRAMLGLRGVVVPLHPDEMATGAGGAT